MKVHFTGIYAFTLSFSVMVVVFEGHFCVMYDFGLRPNKIRDCANIKKVSFLLWQSRNLFLTFTVLFQNSDWFRSSSALFSCTVFRKLTSLSYSLSLELSLNFSFSGDTFPFLCYMSYYWQSSNRILLLFRDFLIVVFAFWVKLPFLHGQMYSVSFRFAIPSVWFIT